MGRLHLLLGGNGTTCLKGDVGGEFCAFVCAM